VPLIAQAREEAVGPEQASLIDFADEGHDFDQPR
jgi:hypothetical protein